MKSFEDPRVIFSFNDITTNICNSTDYLYFTFKESIIYQMKYLLPFRQNQKITQDEIITVPKFVKKSILSVKIAYCEGLPIILL